MEIQKSVKSQEKTFSFSFELTNQEPTVGSKVIELPYFVDKVQKISVRHWHYLCNHCLRMANRRAMILENEFHGADKLFMTERLSRLPLAEREQIYTLRKFFIAEMIAYTGMTQTEILKVFNLYETETETYKRIKCIVWSKINNHPC